MNNIINLPNLEHLRSFVVFIQSENITQAASKLSISQPLLTKHLQELEHTLNIKLFEMAGRKKRLTSFGESFYKIIKTNFLNLDHSIRALLTDSDNKFSEVRIGARQEFLEDIFNILIKEKTKFSLIDIKGEQIESYIRNKAIDVVVTKNLIETSEFIKKPLFTDVLTLIWSNQIKISSNNTAAILNQLSDYTFYDYSPSLLTEALASSINLKIVTEKSNKISNWRNIVKAVQQSKSWSIVPSRYLINTNVSSVVLKNKESLPNIFYIYYSKSLNKHDWFKDIISKILIYFQSN